jgi:hypothetical protein
MTLDCFALHTVGINVDTRAQVRLTSTAQARVCGTGVFRVAHQSIPYLSLRCGPTQPTLRDSRNGVKKNQLADTPGAIPIRIREGSAVLAGLSVPYTPAFEYPIRTGTHCPLQDRLPARCPEETGTIAGSWISELRQSTGRHAGLIPFRPLTLRLDRQCLCGLDPASRSCTRQIFRGGSHHAGTRPRRTFAKNMTESNELSCLFACS